MPKLESGPGKAPDHWMEVKGSSSESEDDILPDEAGSENGPDSGDDGMPGLVE